MKKQLLLLAFLTTLSLGISTSLQAADQLPKRYVSKPENPYGRTVPRYTLDSANQQINLLEKRNKELKRTKPAGYKNEIGNNNAVIAHTRDTFNL